MSACGKKDMAESESHIVCQLMQLCDVFFGLTWEAVSTEVYREDIIAFLLYRVESLPVETGCIGGSCPQSVGHTVFLQGP